MQSKSMFLLMMVIVLSPGCKRNGSVAILLDMTDEIASGRFRRDIGDRVSIAGDFNNWKKDTLFLAPANRGDIYTIDMDNVVRQRKDSQAQDDTLTFKFVHAAGDQRQLGNQGWESIPNRAFSLAQLRRAHPVFVFNEVEDGRRQFEVTFRADVSKELGDGTFMPESGDEVVLTGNFCDWRNDGFPLQATEQRGIYKVRLSMKWNERAMLQCKLSIQSSDGKTKKESQVAKMKLVETSIETALIRFD